MHDREFATDENMNIRLLSFLHIYRGSLILTQCAHFYVGEAGEGDKKRKRDDKGALDSAKKVCQVPATER